MKDLGLFMVRIVVGGLLAGHGAQKLFGAFGGPGIEGTAGMMKGMGLKPPRFWAQLAGASEFFGGLCTALGFMHPAGPLLSLAPMAVATRKVHWGKPIWVTSGGAELPVINMAVATALLAAGPGVFSLDALLGTRLSWKTLLLTLGGLVLGWYAVMNQNAQQNAPAALSTAPARTSNTPRSQEPVAA